MPATQRLPGVKSDSGTWGTILNNFLAVEHAPDGTLLSRGRSFESFGGSLTGSAAAQSAAMSAASAWWTANPGGTLWFGTGMYINMPQILFPVPGCSIRGQGMYATILQEVNGLNNDFVTCFLSPDSIQPNALFCSVHDLMLDCNKANQTSGRGIFFDTVPHQGTAANNDPDFDAHNVVSNVFVKNSKGDGIVCAGRSADYFNNVHIYYCDGRGFVPTFDSFLHSCIVGQSGLEAYRFTTSNVRLTNCAAFYAGNVTASAGAGYNFLSTHNNGIHVSACTAQDNRAQGFLINTFGQANLSACAADSNCTSFAGTLPGVDLFNADRCNIEVVCQDRQWNGTTNTQLNAIRVRTTSFFNKIRITHFAAVGSVGAPVLTWDANCDSNEVNINGSAGQQRVAYAASITPDPTAGGSIIVGTLTGPITIAAVLAGNQWPAQRIRFTLTQDATGGRVITWNAVYHFAGSAAPATAASRSNIIEFEWDATLAIYREVHRSVSVP